MAQQPPYPPQPPYQPPYPQQPPYQPAPYPPQYPQAPYPPSPYPYGPPPKQKRSGCFGCLIAALVIFVLTVVVIGVTFLVARHKVEEKLFPDVHVPFRTGATGTVKTAGQNAHKVTIVGIMDNARSTGLLAQPKPGNRYVAVQVTIENVSNAATAPGDWKLRTSANAEFDRVVGRGIGQDVPSANLSPGTKAQGTILFEIPANATITWVRYDPTETFSGSLFFDVP